MLFNYGEPIDKIFIVRDGEFKIMKRIHKQYTEGTEHRSREKSEYKLRSYPMKQVPFRIIHSGQIIGDCEMLQEQSNYE
jgi:CRP-like cAMP-binding protein